MRISTMGIGALRAKLAQSRRLGTLRNRVGGGRFRGWVCRRARGGRSNCDGGSNDGCRGSNTCWRLRRSTLRRLRVVTTIYSCAPSSSSSSSATSSTAPSSTVETLPARLPLEVGCIILHHRHVARHSVRHETGGRLPSYHTHGSRHLLHLLHKCELLHHQGVHGVHHVCSGHGVDIQSRVHSLGEAGRYHHIGILGSRRDTVNPSLDFIPLLTTLLAPADSIQQAPRPRTVFLHCSGSCWEVRSASRFIGMAVGGWRTSTAFLRRRRGKCLLNGLLINAVPRPRLSS